jgi:2-polyprenyl-3-methyl-5-hydroxy-6-metoxy-1,4-benzoquinol methylase
MSERIEMKIGQFLNFAMKIRNRLPLFLQGITVGILNEIHFLVFRLKYITRSDKNAPNPSKIYWLSPERIVYHTNYIENKSMEKAPLRDRVFGPKMRGKVIDGNWDLTNYRFTDLEVFDSYKKRLVEGSEWRETKFYEMILKQIESGKFPYLIRNQVDLDKRCKYLDSLYVSIKTNGYNLNNRSDNDKNTGYDEIDVNIGRNGEYLFQNGAHRLSIAKILGIKYVPVLVFVRHKKWQKFRDFVISYAQTLPRAKMYQPIVHPDLSDIPYDLEDHNCQDLMRAIKHHLKKESGTMLDIGANLGYFCHKFENLGYQCWAVEQDPVTFEILRKIRIAEAKKFEVINKSIFEVDSVKKMKFDVILALNIFHHFLKEEKTFLQLKQLLRNLDTEEMFFEAHQYHEEQMRDAYMNFTGPEFVDFILKNTSLVKSEVIYTAKNGRVVFKLSK